MRPPPLVGPGFSSYSADDVRWLLTDLGGAAIETGGVERERALQSGASHYSQSLPVEYAPSDAYLRLYEEALATSASTVASAVVTVGERILAARDGAPVLVSLARAGTPIGILLRRWLRLAHGIDAPHYTMSIILDRGIDQVALDHLAAHHRPEQVIFVDGWTGKGTITRELELALADDDRGFRADLAVLVDPAGTATHCGTRDDVLVPSACLNSTVSGLVSRTVRNAELLPEGAFDGAKFYRELADVDRSHEFLDTIERAFPATAPDGTAAVADAHAVRDAVGHELARLQSVHGVASPRLLKPGVCEATRVLLRRVPRALVVRERGAPAVRHLEELAAGRDVPVIEDPASLYAAVGLVAALGEEL